MRHKYRYLIHLLIIIPFISALSHRTQAEALSEPKAPVFDSVLVQMADKSVVPDQINRLIKTLDSMITGKPLTQKMLDDHIALLKRTRWFESIHVDSSGNTIYLTIIPSKRISKIKIVDPAPLFKKEILSTMSLHAGSYILPGDIENQVDRIKRRMEREGIITPHVTITLLPVPGSRRDVVLRITMGSKHWDRLINVIFEGNKAFASAVLGLRTKCGWRSWMLGRSGRLIQQEEKKDVQDLIRYYRSCGYAEVQISTDTIPLKGSDRALKFIIDEGPYYDISIQGNNFYSDRNIKGILVFSETGNIRNMGIRRSIRAIKTMYHEAGFGEVVITHAMKTVEDIPGKPRKQIIFHINEGTRKTVSAITFTGNQHMADSKLVDQMLTKENGLIFKSPLVPEALDDDIQALRTYYEGHGFLDVDIQANSTPNSVEGDYIVTIRISEGPQTLVSEITLSGLPDGMTLSPDHYIASKKGKAFNPFQLSSDEKAIARAVSKNGYPHVLVEKKWEISKDTHSAIIHFDVSPGPKVDIGNIFYSGTLKTNYKVLSENINLPENSIFDMQTVLARQRRIRDLSIFNSVRFTSVGLREKSKTVQLWVDVEEKPPFYIESGIGYETSRGAYARLRLGDDNLFGRIKQGWVSAEVSEIGYRIETGVSDPRFLRSDIKAGASIFAEKSEEFNQTYGTKTIGANWGFSYEWSHKFNLGLGFRLENRERYEREVSITKTDEGSTWRTYLVTTPFVSYDTRDSLVRPTRGIFVSSTMDFSKGFDNSEDDYIKAVIDLRMYRQPWKYMAFAVRGRVGHMAGYGNNEEVPVDQLFYLGGTTTVRGFSENLLRRDDSGNPVGGRTSYLANFETRIPLWNDFEMSLFLDSGSIQNAIIAEGSDRFRYSAGLGIEYITPIGAVGASYGVKLDREPDESSGRLHVFLGYAF